MADNSLSPLDSTATHPQSTVLGQSMHPADAASVRVLSINDLVYIISRELGARDCLAVFLCNKQLRDAWEPYIWEVSNARMLVERTLSGTLTRIRRVGPRIQELFITEPGGSSPWPDELLDNTRALYHYPAIRAIELSTSALPALRVLSVRLISEASFSHLTQLVGLPWLDHLRLYLERRAAAPSMDRAWEALDLVQQVSSSLRSFHLSFPAYVDWNFPASGHPPPDVFEDTVDNLITRLVRLETLSIWNVCLDRSRAAPPFLTSLSYFGIPPGPLTANIRKMELFLNGRSHSSFQHIQAPFLTQLSLTWHALPAESSEIYDIAGWIDQKWHTTLRTLQLMISRSVWSYPYNQIRLIRILHCLQHCSLRRFSIMIQCDCSTDVIDFICSRWAHLRELHLYTNVLFAQWTPVMPTTTSLMQLVRKLLFLRSLTLSLDFVDVPFSEAELHNIARNATGTVTELTLVQVHTESVYAAAHFIKLLFPSLDRLFMDSYNSFDWMVFFDQNVVQPVYALEFEPFRIVKVNPPVRRRKVERRGQYEGWDLYACQG